MLRLLQGSVVREKIQPYVQPTAIQLGLITANVLFVLFGAFVLYQIERPNEVRNNNDTLVTLQRSKTELLDQLWQLYKKDTFDRDEVEESARQLIAVYEEVASRMFHQITYENATVGMPLEDKWTPESALMVAVTIAVPVGYGYVTPATPAGRAFVVAYGLFGIPLTLVTVANLGGFIGEVILMAFQCSVLRLLGRNTTEAQRRLVAIPTAFVLGLLIAYPMLGALLFYATGLESYFEGFYFSLVTIFTIGFGDVTAHCHYTILIAYIVVGVAVVTMCIELVGANVINHIHSMGRRAQRAKLVADRMINLAHQNIQAGLGKGLAQLGGIARMGMMMNPMAMGGGLTGGIDHDQKVTTAGELPSTSTIGSAPHLDGSREFTQPQGFNCSISFIDNEGSRSHLSTPVAQSEISSIDLELSSTERLHRN